MQLSTVQKHQETLSPSGELEHKLTEIIERFVLEQ